MEPVSSAFETLAEIAAALLGFAAVAFALSGGPASLEEEDRLRLLLLLALSVVCIVGGVLPAVLVTSGDQGASIWRTWSAAYALASFQVYMGALITYWRMKRENRKNFHGRTPGVRVIVWTQNLILACVFVTQCLNAFGIWFDGDQALCLIALLLTVVQAAIMLLTIIFLRPQFNPPVQN